MEICNWYHLKWNQKIHVPVAIKLISMMTYHNSKFSCQNIIYDFVKEKMIEIWYFCQISFEIGFLSWTIQMYMTSPDIWIVYQFGIWHVKTIITVLSLWKPIQFWYLSLITPSLSHFSMGMWIDAIMDSGYQTCIEFKLSGTNMIVLVC